MKKPFTFPGDAETAMLQVLESSHKNPLNS